MIPADQQPQVDRLKEGLGEWALGDVHKALAGGAKIGTFLLAAHFIDVLARLAKRKRGDGKAAWDEFVTNFLPAYKGHAEDLYRGYRGALSHQYSARGFRFVDTEVYRHRHWEIEGGDRVLHLEAFLKDLDAAWTKFVEQVEADDDFRERVLARVQEAPLLGIVWDRDIGASGSTSFTRTLGATGFAAAQAASGAPAPGGAIRCSGTGGAPRINTTGKGLHGGKIGQCSMCQSWHKLSGVKIPPHTPGQSTYNPFP